MESLPRSILADTGPLFALIHAGDVDLTADLDARDVEYMRRLTGKYDTMDLADASLVAVGERLSVLDVITLDRRDFSRYRTRARRAFTNHFPERE